MRLAEQVCLVTGGGSGIGEATALLFAREGGRVVVADRDPQRAERVAAAIETAGGFAIAMAVDVAVAAEVRRMVETTVERFGRIDVLVNNAGYGIKGTILETSEEDWDALMATNLKGVFLCAKHVLPVMQRQRRGVVVNTASTTSFVGITDRAAYCASKGGVASLTRAMALDHVGDGIRVNAVAPGTIETPYFSAILAAAGDPAAERRSLEARQAMDRMGRPEEIAAAILFLASDESSFCTGLVMPVDGGMTAR